MVTPVRFHTVQAAPAQSRRRLVTAALVAVVAWPTLTLVTGWNASDSFPLSNYPMFANDRGAVANVPTVVAVRADGEVDRLDPQTIAGTDQVVQVWENVKDAIAGGPETAGALCREVAARPDDGDDDDDLARVEVAQERHDVVAWADGDREPLDRRVVASCEVGG